MPSYFGLRHSLGNDVIQYASPVHERNFAQAELNVNAYAKFSSPKLEDMDSLGENLRAARKAAKLTQTQLAVKAGSSTTTVSDIERGRNARSKDLFEFARVLGVSVEWLMTGEDQVSEEEAVIQEFSITYRHSTDEGRHFLRSAIQAAKGIASEVIPDRPKLISHK